MSWADAKDFVRQMLSEKGEPSSARVLTVILHLWSMGLIAWCVKHMMHLPADQLSVWVNGLPWIIGALAAFAASPYAISKGTSSLADLIGKKKD